MNCTSSCFQKERMKCNFKIIERNQNFKITNQSAVSFCKRLNKSFETQEIILQFPNSAQPRLLAFIYNFKI